MSGKIDPERTKRMSLEELEGSASVPRNNGKMGYSAFSTATHHKDHMGYTHDKTNDGSHFQIASPLQKYKVSLKLFGKTEEPIFKQTKYIVPNLDEEDDSETQQKQNNKGMSNTANKQYRKQQPAQDYGKHIPWGSASKSETAEIVRSLFGGQRTDYNLEYRKKKFFKHFSHPL